jgi:hypothetical protein
MVIKLLSMTVDFRDYSEGTLLAQYDKKFISLIWSNKYELRVFSNKFPDAICFLGLVARDHRVAQGHEG